MKNKSEKFNTCTVCLSKTQTGLRVPTALSFKCKKDSTFSAQISFILAVNFRYIVNLQTFCVDLQVSTSKTQNTEFYVAQQANLDRFFFKLGLFKANRSRLQICRFIAYE